MKDKFTCAQCCRTFAKVLSDAETTALQTSFGTTCYDPMVICDDCLAVMIATVPIEEGER